MKAALTLSLCSLRLMMTAVICWSINMRMVQSRAGRAAIGNVHQGLGPSGSISQPRFFDVGCSQKTNQFTPMGTSCLIHYSSLEHEI